MARTQPAPSPGAWLSRVALLLLLVVVGARALLQEMLRDVSAVVPGAVAPPRGAMAPAGIALDLLLALPALLVLVRRAFDPAFRLRWHLSFIPLGLLAFWAVLSNFWAADRFAALVNALHLVGAGAALFAAAQVVRDWVSARLVAGLALGLLLVLLAYGIDKRMVELPETVREWNDRSSPNSRWHYMENNHLTEQDFQFQQYERKLLGMELTGFSSSANTYGAMIAVMLVVLLGCAAQRLDDGARLWLIVPLALIPAAGYVIYYTHSRQSVGTPVLALAVLAALYWVRPWLARHAKRAYIALVVAFFLGVGALVGHGLYHGNLGDRSLTFRWYYWTGGARMVAHHPLLGVGWSNFGQYYPAVRPAGATEEVQDPHNILVRAFAELGIPGGLLLLAFLLRFGWDLTQPPLAPEPATPSDRPPLPRLAILALGVVALTLLAGHDFSKGMWWFILQGSYAIIGACLLTLGLGLVTIKSFGESVFDGREAPWIWTGLALAAGISFLHNLIDFSWSDPGPLSLFALLGGSALAIRQPAAQPQPTPAGRRAVLMGLGLGAGAWLAVGLLWVQVAIAEDSSAQADELIRSAMTDGRINPGAAAMAASADADARAALGLNADYAFRQAQALALSGADRATVAAACDAAIAGNPRQVKYRAFRAELALASKPPDVDTMIANMNKAVELDPRSVDLRIRYGDMLAQVGRPDAARVQYRAALALDAQLPADEPQRLGKAARAELEKKAAPG